jgi:hypothetical protein
MEYCNTPDSFWNNSKEIDNLLVYGHWARNSCSHCQRQCNQDFYIAYTEMTKMKPSENKISKLRVFYQVEKQILISTRPSRVNFWFLILGRISHSTRSKRAPTMERFPYSAISADRLVSCWAFLCWPSARLSTPSFKLVCRLADDWSTNAGEWIKTEFYNRTRGWFFLRFKIQLRKYLFPFISRNGRS